VPLGLQPRQHGHLGLTLNPDADLCWTLPTGEIVPFVERSMHYAIDVLHDAGADDALYAGVDTLDDGEADRWHRRLGHLSLGRVHKTLKELGIRATARGTTPRRATPASRIAGATATLASRLATPARSTLSSACASTRTSWGQ